MKPQLKVYPEGITILTNSGKIEAQITAVCIRNNQASYEASYIHNGTHQQVWLKEYEFTPAIPKKISIGYKNE